uniref:Uncharacterized protein n=1 Tax=Ciona intestinalis TaxID=7719 RepID=H2XYU2_CIOIN
MRNKKRQYQKYRLVRSHPRLQPNKTPCKGG